MKATILILIGMLTVLSCFCQSFSKKLLIGKWHSEDSAIVMNLIFVDSVHATMELMPKGVENFEFKKFDTSKLHVDVDEIYKLFHPTINSMYLINNIQGNDFTLKMSEIGENGKLSDIFTSKCTFKNSDLFTLEMTLYNVKEVKSFSRTK